jgi:hypothetical protein
MKTFLYLLCSVLNISLVYTCPSCVARVNESTPPFFTQEFYTEPQESYDAVVNAKTGQQNF